MCVCVCIYTYSSHICHLAHGLVASAPPLVKILILWAGDDIFICIYLFIHIYICIYISIYSSRYVTSPIVS